MRGCFRRNLRNLSPYQRAELALELEPLIAEKAKERQREHGGTAPGKKSLPQNSAEVNETRKEIARAARVSHDTIAKVRVISKKAAEQEAKRAERGRRVWPRSHKAASGRTYETWPWQAGPGILAAVEPVTDYETWQRERDCREQEARDQAALAAHYERLRAQGLGTSPPPPEPSFEEFERTDEERARRAKALARLHRARASWRRREARGLPGRCVRCRTVSIRHSGKGACRRCRPTITGANAERCREPRNRSRLDALDKARRGTQNRLEYMRSYRRRPHVMERHRNLVRRRYWERKRARAA